MPEALMPWISGLFLVFTGILTGYFLWCRNRSRDHLQRLNLEAENHGLRQLLEKSQSQHQRLQRERREEQGRVQQLEAELTRTQQQSTAQQRERQSWETERAALSVKLADAENLSGGLQERLSEAHCAIQELKQTHQRQLAAEQSRFQSERSGLQSKIDELTDSATQTSQILRARTTELHEASARLAAAQTELETQRTILETTLRNRTGLEQEYVSLENSLRQHTELLKQARGDAAAAESARATAESALRDAHHQLAAQSAAQTELVHQHDALKLAHEELQQAHRELEASVAELSSERERAAIQHRELVARLDATVRASAIDQMRAEAWIARSQNQTGTIRWLRRKLQAALDHARATEADRATILARQSAQDAAKEQELSKRLSGLKQSQQELAERYRTAREQVQQAEIRREQLEQNVLTQLAQNRELTRQLQRLQQERQDWLASREAALRDRSELESLRGERESVQAAATEAQIALAELRQERDALAEEREELSERRDEQFELLAMQAAEFRTRLELTIQQRDRALMDLQRLKATAREAAPRPPQAHPADKSAAETISLAADTPDPVRGGVLRTDPRRGKIYVVAPHHPDDLKQISGIANVLEQRLNGLGIYTFQQIMNWDENEVAEFSALLAFGNRISRDRWVEQARELHPSSQRRAA